MPRGTKSTSATGLYFNADIEKQRDNVIMGQLNSLIAEVADLKTQLATHVHGGVTAGAANTAVPGTITYTVETDYVG